MAFLSTSATWVQRLAASVATSHELGLPHLCSTSSRSLSAGSRLLLPWSPRTCSCGNSRLLIY